MTLSLQELEANMRPGALSLGGFLGSSEKLDEILKMDEETVKRLGLTHSQIADRIEYFLKACGGYPPFNPKTVDEKFNVSGVAYRGIQLCPWGDAGKYSNSNWEILNTEKDEKLKFPGLIVHLIRDHSFYEGKQSPYRVDPENVARVLELI